MVQPDRAAIAALPGAEQAAVHEVLDEERQQFEDGRLFLSADKLRAVVRGCMESLHPIRVRPSGGVYFVRAQYAKTLAALRELVGRFGNRSNLARVPLPDQQGMRDMVISAFVSRSKDELDGLADEIRKAQSASKVDAAGDPGAAPALYRAGRPGGRARAAALGQRRRRPGEHAAGADAAGQPACPGKLRTGADVTELREVMVTGPPGIRCEATRGRRPRG